MARYEAEYVGDCNKIYSNIINISYILRYNIIKCIQFDFNKHFCFCSWYQTQFTAIMRHNILLYQLLHSALAPSGARASSLSRLHDHFHTHHTKQVSSGRVISPSQRPLPDNTQHSLQTEIHAPGGIRNSNPSKRAAAVPRLRPRGHCDRHSLNSDEEPYVQEAPDHLTPQDKPQTEIAHCDTHGKAAMWKLQPSKFLRELKLLNLQRPNVSYS